MFWHLLPQCLIVCSTHWVLKRYLSMNSWVHGQTSFPEKPHPLEAVATILNTMQCRGPFREVWASWTCHSYTQHHPNCLRNVQTEKSCRQRKVEGVQGILSALPCLALLCFLQGSGEGEVVKYLIRHLCFLYLKQIVSVTCWKQLFHYHVFLGKVRRGVPPDASVDYASDSQPQLKS